MLQQPQSVAVGEHDIEQDAVVAVSRHLGVGFGVGRRRFDHVVLLYEGTVHDLAQRRFVFHDQNLHVTKLRSNFELKSKRRTLLQIKSYPLHETCRLSRPPSPATDRSGNEDGNYNERLGRRMRQGLPPDDRFDPCNSLVATEAGETFRASTVHEEGDVEIHIAGQNLKTRSLSTMDFVSSQRFTGVKIRHKNKVPLCKIAERHLRGLKRIRTAVQGFADLCLATRPSDQIADLSSFGTSRIANISKLRTLLPTLLAGNSERIRSVLRLQIYKHFSFLQNLSGNFRFSLKNPYLYIEFHPSFSCLDKARIRSALRPA